MYQSDLISKTRKQIAQNEESLNANILIKAGFIEQVMAGVYAYLPLGYKVLRNIETIVREELENISAQELLLPALHPKSYWEKTGRWDSLDVLYKFTSYYTSTELALGSTHEEIITPIAKNFIQSYQDLPLAVYQIQTKFRDEKRAKSGILRGREFIMKDLYSFHSSADDLDKYYELVTQAYTNIYKRLGIGDITLKTYASGGSFSKYSHEFQTIADIGEDTTFVCEKCNIAVNKEIIEEQNTCPECGNSNLIQKQSIEVGNIFKLQTKYSEAFNLEFTDKNGVNKPVIMGCYGIGISRLMGTLVEVFAQNESKMLWPASVTPFDIHLIALNTDSEEVIKKSEELYTKLQEKGQSVLFDNRNERPGIKFTEADLIGITKRIIISYKTLAQNGVEIDGQIIPFEDL
ncbi:prolyl-tRNA synthetase [bacterium]|nr:prolyl-tRNA synthetase [Candidatus Elulimicrobium humile]